MTRAGVAALGRELGLSLRVGDREARQRFVEGLVAEGLDPDLAAWSVLPAPRSPGEQGTVTP